MNEIGHSIAEAIRKRSPSSALGLYLFFWAAFHWQGIYVTLFTSQDMIFKQHDVLKNEYVNQYFFGWRGWETIYLYVAPIIMTALFIWLVPKYVLVHTYRQEQRHKVNMRRIRYEEEERLEVAKKDLAVQQKETVQAEIETSRAIKVASIDDPTIAWQHDMLAFLDDENGYSALLRLKKVIYEDKGHLVDYRTSGGDWKVVQSMSSDHLALVHTNDLVTMKKGDESIELTDKGKYFISKLGSSKSTGSAKF